jgi:integrase
VGVTVGRRRDRGFWYVAVHQGGQRARLQCDSEAEARALARHVARLELAGQNVIVALKLARETPPPDPSSPTLRAALPPWIARRAALGEIRHSTAKAYRDRCARWLYEHTLGDGVRVGDLPVTEIRREHLGAVILRIREAGRSRAIVNAIIAPMSRYCAELVEAGVLAVNPAHDLARYLGRLRKPARGLRPLHFSPEEVPQLLATARSVSPRWYPFIATGLLAGLRYGELAALRPADVDLTRGALRVERTVSDRHRIEPVKDGEGRTVTISPALSEILRAQLDRLDPGSDVLFPTKAGGRLVYTYFSARLWGRLLQKAGLPYRKPHALRHSYAVTMLAAGADLRLVKD